MFEKLAMVTRFVSDQETALEFYTQTLGFDLVRDNQGPHGRFVTVAPTANTGAELILMTPDGFGEAADALRALVGNDPGLIYAVEDCRNAYEVLVERGVEFRSEPQDMPWGTQAALVDPDGNEIVIQDRI